MAESPTELVAATSELIEIPSVSRHEAEIADHVERVLTSVPWLIVDRIGDNVVARTDMHRDSRVILAGHLDTVPAAENTAAVITDEGVSGLGAADMKGGLAVMLALAVSLREPNCDVTYICYAREEIARSENGLLELDSNRPDLLVADLAILGEPTATRVEAGCQGVLRVDVELRGRRAHTARPWMGENAIHRLGPLLAAVAGYESRRPLIDGCEYREALQVVGVGAGVAGNVVPDRCAITINHRFAPDRDVGTAYEKVCGLIGPTIDPTLGDEITLTDFSPAAPPALSHPVLAELVRISDHPPRAKLGWTDVAFFAERGVPAANYGPGDPELAHTPGEYVTGDELRTAYRVLSELLSSP